MFVLQGLLLKKTASPKRLLQSSSAPHWIILYKCVGRFDETVTGFSNSTKSDLLIPICIVTLFWVVVLECE